MPQVALRKQSLTYLILIAVLICLPLRADDKSRPAIAEALRQQTAHLKLKPTELTLLLSQEVLSRSVSTKKANEMGSFGALITTGETESFVAAYRSLAIFDKQPSVLAVGHISVKPTIADLAKLTLEENDLEWLFKCKVGKCDVKLSATEIERIQKTVGNAKKLTVELKQKLGDEYKKILLERAANYFNGGLSDATGFADKTKAIDPQEAFLLLSKAQAEGDAKCLKLLSYLETYPQAELAQTESFVYWAKQKFDQLRPVVSLVHVIIHRDGPCLFIACKQIYASHYSEAGLSMLELIKLNDTRAVLAYTVRLKLDAQPGFVSSLMKKLGQPKMNEAMKLTLTAMRRNVEAKAATAQ